MSECTSPKCDKMLANGQLYIRKHGSLYFFKTIISLNKFSELILLFFAFYVLRNVFLIIPNVLKGEFAVPIIFYVQFPRR
jgi:hypothetical protein